MFWYDGSLFSLTFSEAEPHKRTPLNFAETQCEISEDF